MLGGNGGGSGTGKASCSVSPSCNIPFVRSLVEPIVCVAIVDVV